MTIKVVPTPDQPSSDCILDVASKARQAVAQLDKGNVSMDLEIGLSIPFQLHPSEK